MRREDVLAQGNANRDPTGPEAEGRRRKPEAAGPMAVAHSNLPYNRKKLKELGISDEELRESLEVADRPLGLEDRLTRLSLTTSTMTKSPLWWTT